MAGRGALPAGRSAGMESGAGVREELGEVRIGIVCPIGFLDRHGYQHVYEPCIRSMANFAERVYLVQSVNAPAGRDKVRFPNVRVMSQKFTWFERDYDGEQINKNLDYGFQAAAWDGMDIAILMASNWYIPENRWETLWEHCEQFMKTGNEIGWLY